MDSLEHEPWIELFVLALAGVAGLLVGLEREQSTPRPPGEPDPETRPIRFAGVRTFVLIGLSGALSALLAGPMGPGVLLVALGGLLALAGVHYVHGLRHEGEPGQTTEHAAVFTFLLGALAAAPVIQPLRWRVATVIGLAVAVTALLSGKPNLHGLARRITRRDLLATLQFLLTAAVVLPVVPRQGYGPFEAFNPFEIVLMVVLISAISFVGYLAVRLIGPRRGMGLTGILGGLASSTAITLSMAGRARHTPSLGAACLLAILLASTIMFGRVVAEVAIVQPSLVPRVVVPMGVMGMVGLVASALAWRASRRHQPNDEDTEVELKNPFQLGTSVSFGVLFALVNLLSKAGKHWLGDAGVYVTGLVAGATDVDAITLSMANLAGDDIAPAVAATTILIGALSNTAVKAGMAAVLGGWAFGRRVVLSFAVVIAAGAATVPLL